MPAIIKGKRTFEIPSTPVSLGDVRGSKTGGWRYMRPKYEDKTPPCNHACPAGINIVKFLMLVEAGKLTEAWRTIKKENPFPGVCGRVCPHPCETHCNRSQYDQPVSINHLERFVADATTRRPSRDLDRPKRRFEKIAIIGSGPAGLSCAYHLARLGYNPEVFETLPMAGGILRFGIPTYRLPTDTLDREIADIEKLGVTIQTNSQIDKTFFHNLGRTYQVITIATGAHGTRGLGIPGDGGEGIIPGLAFLKKIRMGGKVQLGKRVAVIGGGNTALDAARSARRMGSDPIVLYRRSRDEMPAFTDEIEESLEEGIHFEFQIQPIRVIRENGRVAGLECIRTRLAGVDDSGRKRPVFVDGSNFTIDIDQVLVAIGETPDISLIPPHVQQEWRSLTLGDVSTRESVGLFFSGDLVSPLKTVAHAIGSGKKAALSIDAFITKENASEILQMSQIGDSGGVSVEKLRDKEYQVLSRHVVSFDELNTAYFEPMRRTDTRRSPVARRIKDFSEVKTGLTRREARYEAGRCFGCGTCNECENCYVFCPDISILKKANRIAHEIDYDMCKGCGICFTECPRRAISMEEEKR